MCSSLCVCLCARVHGHTIELRATEALPIQVISLVLGLEGFFLNMQIVYPDKRAPDVKHVWDESKR